MSEIQFPMGKAKKLRDQPRNRYEFAVQYLPLPAAFREAAKGLRAIVRERKREDEPFEEPLRELYTLACIRNLVHTTGVPVYWSLPTELWEGLDFPYAEIGYERLDLLGTRDRGRIGKLWGEPDQHRDVGDVLPRVAERFSSHGKAVAEQEEREHQQGIAAIRDKHQTASKGSGCFVVLGAVLVGVLALLG